MKSSAIEEEELGSVVDLPSVGMMRFWLRNRILVMLNSQICVQRLLGRVFDTSGKQHNLIYAARP